MGPPVQHVRTPLAPGCIGSLPWALGYIGGRRPCGRSLVTRTRLPDRSPSQQRCQQPARPVSFKPTSQPRTWPASAPICFRPLALGYSASRPPSVPRLQPAPQLQRWPRNPHRARRLVWTQLYRRLCRRWWKRPLRSRPTACQAPLRPRTQLIPDSGGSLPRVNGYAGRRSPCGTPPRLRGFCTPQRTRAPRLRNLSVRRPWRQEAEPLRVQSALASAGSLRP